VPVVAAVAVVAGLVGWLGIGRGGAEGGGPPSGSGAAGAIVGPPILDVVQEGGFVAPDVLFGRLPSAFVSADGRMISVGPQILIYPGPALPNLQQRQLTAAGVAGLRSLAEAAGLARRPPDYGLPPVADVPTTVFTYVDADGRTFVHRVEALGFDAGLNDAQREARAGLSRLLEQLADPEGSLGSGEVGPDTALEPDAFRMRAAPAVAAPDGEEGVEEGIEPRVVPWPVDSVRLAQPAGCTPVTGPDAVALRAALRSADQLTRWTQDGVTYTVQVRPVLPGETVCA
jgi:hypothetical protein